MLLPVELFSTQMETSYLQNYRRFERLRFPLTSVNMLKHTNDKKKSIAAFNKDSELYKFQRVFLSTSPVASIQLVLLFYLRLHWFIYNAI